MYLNSCSKARRTNNEKQPEEKNGKGKERIWKEKREDKRAAYWGMGVHCEWLMRRQDCWVPLPSNKNGLIHPSLSQWITAPQPSLSWWGFCNFPSCSLTSFQESKNSRVRVPNWSPYISYHFRSIVVVFVQSFFAPVKKCVFVIFTPVHLTAVWLSGCESIRSP